MAKIYLPFNISILNLDDENLRTLPKITELSIFDSSKEVFHPEGLYSDKIFGPIGSEMRYKVFAYIDIKLKVIHPVIYQALIKARKFYRDIMSGVEYAVFNQQKRDFEKSDVLQGETGYAFFIRYFSMLSLQDTGSDDRKRAIALLQKYKDKVLLDKVIVMPAGYRDVEFKDRGPTPDELNTYYQALIRQSNNISLEVATVNEALYDKTRYAMQEALNDLYNAIAERVEGKKKLFLGKWAARRVFNTSRNVITSSAPGGRYLLSEASVGFNDNLVGLYQAMKGVLPVSIYHIKNSILSELFVSANIPVPLVNKDTLMLEDVQVKPKTFDHFASSEGIEELINDYEHESQRHKPVMVDDHYLSLTYLSVVDGKKVFKLFRDIRDLPAEYDRKDVHPTTYTEFFYVVLAPILNKHNAVVTRYPISGPGSCQVCKTKIKTTIQDEIRYQLDDEWKISDKIYYSFPVLGEKTQEAMSPPVSILGAMGADFDGDTMSFNPVYSDEALEETDRLLRSKGAYLDSMGNFLRTTDVDIVNIVCFNLSS